MKVHLIAIGGSVMHQLAIALQQQGHLVTGSDDEIFDPSKARLEQHGLLPATVGWHPERIHSELDYVIVGMHARSGNPELEKAHQLGIQVLSFPQLIYQQSRNSQRVVVAGSHGKTTITAMVCHVLQHVGKDFNFLAGAPIAGEMAVRLEEDQPVIVIEGDEYPTSPLDRQPKFLHYHHHIAVISGIAWDHANVFPDEASYREAFAQLIAQTRRAGAIIYHQDDPILAKMIKQADLVADVDLLPYQLHPHKIKDGITYLVDEHKNLIPLRVFGAHNLQNISAAFEVCQKLRVEPEQFYKAMSTFAGASMRLQLLAGGQNGRLFRDFAHAPSKLKATNKAVKQQFGKQKLVACIELHTFSSLNADYLHQYRHTFDDADEALVYYSPQTVAHKKLPALSPAQIIEAFGRKNLQVFTDPEALEAHLMAQNWANTNCLLMSSGHFGGLDVARLAEQHFQTQDSVAS